LCRVASQEDVDRVMAKASVMQDDFPTRDASCPSPSDNKDESKKLAKTRLIIQVADTGRGIPPELTSVIFQPFNQADTSTTREYGGSGLGLTIAKQFAIKMGGNICVDSTVPSVR